MVARKTLILGGGMTGLAAGIASGLPVYEAAPRPGGICSSYYMRAGSDERLARPPDDDEAYRFELGGGHWIFGGDPTVLQFISSMVTLATYQRRSSVHFPGERLSVPYPIQDHLRFLAPGTAAAARSEMSGGPGPSETMREWLEQRFGPTLCREFFHPFHRLYTAGLYDRIAPQDAYKSPRNRTEVGGGASRAEATAGYNASFVYPVEGLGALAERMAGRCRIRYGSRAVRIDLPRREVHFADGRHETYDRLVSTLPLRRVVEMAGLPACSRPDPYTSVLVVNVGAPRGPNCPDDHWLYHPATASGFHRVGFYSVVDRRFLPRSARASEDRVSLYVERAYPEGARPAATELDATCRRIVAELESWGFIGPPEVVDPTWIDVAYTWRWPGSAWSGEALATLAGHDVFQVGRYARWSFQGIADSIRDGLCAGAGFRA